MKLPILLALLVCCLKPQDVGGQDFEFTDATTTAEIVTAAQQTDEATTLPSAEEVAVEVTTQQDESVTISEAPGAAEVDISLISTAVAPSEITVQNEAVSVDTLQIKENATSTTAEATTLASTTVTSLLNETVELLPSDQAAVTVPTEQTTSSPTTTTKTTTPTVQTESTVTTTEPTTTTTLEIITESTTTTKQPTETTSIETTVTSHTSEKRSTLPATTATPVHECVTAMSCVDPNAHCVSVYGRNTCQCRMGYRKTARGICVELATTQPPSTSTFLTSTSPTSLTDGNATSNNAGSDLKKIPVKRAEDLSSDEELDVVSIGLRPPISVVEWLLKSEQLFRSSVAKILTDTGLQTSLDEEIQNISISAEQVLYVAPSPQYVDNELLVSIVVENSEQIPIKSYSLEGTVARHRRSLRTINTTIPKYFPAIWVVRSLRLNQDKLEQSLNQTISTLYGGEVPRKLFLFEQYASAGLFEWRLEILIPALLAVLLFFLIVLSVVCLKAKKRTTATWDPPAGIIFGKKPQKGLKEEREDPLGSVSKMSSSGQNLATDEQCREGEDRPVKPARLNSDDDVWVVPYEDGPSDMSRCAIRAQFEDTKL